MAIVHTERYTVIYTPYDEASLELHLQRRLMNTNSLDEATKFVLGYAEHVKLTLLDMEIMEEVEIDRSKIKFGNKHKDDIESYTPTKKKPVTKRKGGKLVISKSTKE